MVNVKQDFPLYLKSVIFLSCLAIAVFGHFTEIDFGIIGILAWIVVLGGVGYFILGIINELFG